MSTQPPCTLDPRRWDLDQGTMGDWLRAIAGCQQLCPRLAECRRDLQTAPAGDRPQAVVQAGIPFGATRVPLTLAALRRRASRIEHHARNADPIETHWRTAS